MDAGTLFIIIIGVVVGIFLAASSSKNTTRVVKDEDELDDWDQQDQLEGDEI